MAVAVIVIEDPVREREKKGGKYLSEYLFR